MFFTFKLELATKLSVFRNTLNFSNMNYITESRTKMQT